MKHARADYMAQCARVEGAGSMNLRAIQADEQATMIEVDLDHDQVVLMTDSYITEQMRDRIVEDWKGLHAGPRDVPIILWGGLRLCVLKGVR